jgi:phosphoenolpyruvate carboxykinase (ATP)
MTETGKRAKNATITDLGIKNAKAFWNLSSKELSKIAVEKGQAKITSQGAIAINTGEFTGRSPLDRFIVKDNLTKEHVWWGDVNQSFDENKFDLLHEKMLKHLKGKELYVRDAYACAEEKYRMNIRVVNEYSWSNLFAYNMFLRPNDIEI